MAPPATSPLDILADELGAAAGRIERELRQGFEALTARVDARLVSIELAALKAENERQERFTARLAELRDGRDGKDGEVGQQGERGLPGERGEKGEKGDIGEMGERGLPGEEGKSGERGEKGAPGDRGEPGERGLQGLQGERGEPGERGADGAPGKLPVAKTWSARVHYEGDVVAHDGATYQALRDTGGAPPSQDWQLLAAKGMDARPFRIRGTFDAVKGYEVNDVVAVNGSSFVALKNDPGACPGEDWQLMASAGRRGEKGPPGERIKGDRGASGTSIIAARVEGMSLVFVTSDGNELSADLAPIAEQILAAAP